MEYLGSDIFTEFRSYYRWKARNFCIEIVYKYVCSEENAIKFIRKFNTFLLRRYIRRDVECKTERNQ